MTGTTIAATRGDSKVARVHDDEIGKRAAVPAAHEKGVVEHAAPSTPPSRTSTEVTPLVRIDAGGAGVEGRPDWVADTDGDPSRYTSKWSSNHHGQVTGLDATIDASVPDGTDAKIFASFRGDEPGMRDLEYDIRLTPGLYEVRLYFVEHADIGTGERVFDIHLEDELALADYDIVADAGGRGIGVMRAFVVESSWALDIGLRHGEGTPIISGIEVLPAPDGATPGPVNATQGSAPTTTAPAPTPTTTARPVPPTTSPPAPTTTAPPPPVTHPPAASGERLTHAPPALSNPTVVEVSADNNRLDLDDDRDYIVKMPPTPLDVSGGLTIIGGNDVVLIGGEIHFSRWYPGDTKKVNRALYLKNQTGVVHVEGLRISGLAGEGIDLSQSKGAVVQLQNIHVDQVTGSQSGNHADLLQTWAGPRKLLIDGFTGATTYQGFFLAPNQHYSGPAPELFDFRRVDIRSESGVYLLWLDRTRAPYPVAMHDVWVEPKASQSNRDSYLWPKAHTGRFDYSAVTTGTPPVGDHVDSAGIGYVSPGYR